MMDQYQTKKCSDLLYKYCPSLDATNSLYYERLFVHNEIYYQNPLKFNDPFDCRSFTISWGDRPKDEIRKFLTGLYPEGINEQTNELFNLLVENELHKHPVLLDSLLKAQINLSTSQRVFCVSEVNDEILMWSHYTTGHRGFCLAFHFDEAFPVHYSDNNMFPEMNILDTFENRIKSTLLTKSNKWKHEKEWRLFRSDNGTGVFQFDPYRLKEIIFGYLMSDDDIKAIYYWIHQGKTNPKFYRAIKKQNEFGLIILPIDHKINRS